MREQSLVVKRSIRAAIWRILKSCSRSVISVTFMHWLVQEANHYQEKSFKTLRVIRDRLLATAQPELAANYDEVTEMRVSCEEG